MSRLLLRTRIPRRSEAKGAKTRIRHQKEGREMSYKSTWTFMGEDPTFKDAPAGVRLEVDQILRRWRIPTRTGSNF